MIKARWALTVAVAGALVVFAGDALAKKGGGGKPGGDPPNTTPPDIAFMRGNHGGADALWVMQDDGTGQTQITPRGALGSATWSPDGTQIAFRADGFDSGLGTGVYVVDVDGTDLRRVTVDSGDFYRLRWCPQAAPDGTQWLAFHEQGDLFLLSLDGTTVLNVSAQLEASNPAIPEMVCSWSPDGARLLYHAAGDYDGYRIIEFSYDANGDLVLPTTFVDIPSTTAHVSFGADWAKTSDQLVFEENGDLFVIDFSDLDDISPAVNITNSADTEYSGSWSPDDTRIMFRPQIDSNGGRKYTFSVNIITLADGSQEVILDGNNPGHGFVWRRPLP